MTVDSAADLMNTGDSAYDDYMNASAITILTVKASYLSVPVIATTSVLPLTKSATVSNLPDGDYLFTISRTGFLVRDMSVTVANNSIELGNKPLLAGDVFADGIIDGSDSESLFSKIGFSFGDPDYLVDLDLNLDGIIDGTDSETLLANLGADVGFYNESVNYYN